MNANDMFPSKYLKASDIEADDMILTIKSIEFEKVGTEADEPLKPVVYFDESKKGLVLNKTNNSTIIGMHGQETDGWIGKKIALFPQEVDFQGKQTMAIRVRMRTPKSAPVATIIVSSAKDITAFWAYAKSIGIDQATGRSLVSECNGNFADALKALQGDTPQPESNQPVEPVTTDLPPF